MASWGLSSESQVRAQAKYDASHTTRFSLKLNNKTDADIIKWLYSQASVQGAIKELIRKELASRDKDLHTGT